MPKERIKDISNDFDVLVGWSDGTVQVGIAARYGKELSEFINDSSSVWSTLDREAINKLIRTLRRARDSAYGADA